MLARARSVWAGSTRTSCASVSSAWRILGRVIRFMCGQRRQGRPISVSGYHIRDAGSTAAQEIAFAFRSWISRSLYVLPAEYFANCRLFCL